VWLLIGFIESDLELFLLVCLWLRWALSQVVIISDWRVYNGKLVRLLNLINYFIKWRGSNGVPLSYFGRYRLYFERLNDSILCLKGSHYRTRRFILTYLAHWNLVNIIDVNCKILISITGCIIKILYLTCKFRHLRLRLTLSLWFFWQVFNMKDRWLAHILQIYCSADIS